MKDPINIICVVVTILSGAYLVREAVKIIDFEIRRIASEEVGKQLKSSPP